MPKKKYPRYGDTSSPHKEVGVKTPYHAGRAKYQEPAEVSGFTRIIRSIKRNKRVIKNRVFFGKKDPSFN